MIRCIRLLTVLFVAWSIPSVLAARLSFAAAAYKLPVPPSQPIFVTQGQNEGDHQAENGSQWALDFATAHSRPFVVVAARSGTVIGLRSDSTIQCRSLDTRIDGTPLPGCWTYANFVLIGHADDGTADLYLHLQNKSIMVSVGQPVEQGQLLATAGTTGYSSDIHLHFQVEAMPCVSSDAATVAIASCQVVEKPPWLPAAVTRS